MDANNHTVILGCGVRSVYTLKNFCDDERRIWGNDNYRLSEYKSPRQEAEELKLAYAQQFAYKTNGKKRKKR